MKQVRKIVLFTVILSLILSTLAYADTPIDTIIDTTPGAPGWQDFTDGSSAGDVTENTYEEASSGWLVDIINMFLAVAVNGWLMPLLGALGGVDNISKIIFNYDTMTRLSFFDTAGGGMAGGLMNAIAPIYVAFRYIAIICYIAIILYLAIRMLLSTVGKQKAMYKELIKHWVSGVLILLTFNWLMTYTIVLSDTLVEILASSVGYNGTIGDKLLGNSLGSLTSILKAGILAGIYMLILVGINLAVWWTYIKRLFTVALLIMVFPLVTISYVFDKIGDRKSQILSAWTREFMQNVFIQPIQAVALILIMMAMKATTTMGWGTALLGPIIRLMLLFMLFPAEKLLKKIFQVNPSIGGAGFSGAGAGLMSTMMLAGKVAPILGNNYKRLGEAREANAALNNAQRKYDAGKLKKADLDAAKQNARAANVRAFEGAASILGGGIGAGLGGVNGALGLAGGADKLVNWSGGKYGTSAAKNDIGNEMDKMKKDLNNNNLDSAQKKNLANMMGISTTELDRMLNETEGGKAYAMAKIDAEKNARLAHLKFGKESAEEIRNNFNDSVKLDKATGNFLNAAGNEIGQKGKLRVGRNAVTALDSNGKMMMNLLDKEGNNIKNTKLGDGEYIDYGYEISDTTDIKIEGTPLETRAKENARKKTLQDAQLWGDGVSAEEQTRYLESASGSKQYNKNYSSARQDEVKFVEEKRTETGIQTLQITEITPSGPAPAPGTPAPGTPAPGTPAPGTPAPGTPAPGGGTIPQAAPVAAAPINTEELKQAIISAFQSSMSSVASNMGNAMSAELKPIIEGLKSDMGNGSSVKIETDIDKRLEGISVEMARTLQTAANDYTKAVTNAQSNADNFIRKFALTSSSADSDAEIQIRYSEETAKRVSDARRRAGLDAI